MSRSQSADEQFETAIRNQAQAAGAAAAETVSARVSRQHAFANLGHARSGHVVPLDEPPEFGGSGSGLDPAEALLLAIGASLSVTLTVHAVLADIKLLEVAVELTGKLDPARFFTPSSAPGGGLFDLRLDVVLGSDADRPALQALLDRALNACPVLRSVAAVPKVSLQTKVS